VTSSPLSLALLVAHFLPISQKKVEKEEDQDEEDTETDKDQEDSSSSESDEDDNQVNAKKEAVVDVKPAKARKGGSKATTVPAKHPTKSKVDHSKSKYQYEGQVGDTDFFRAVNIKGKGELKVGDLITEVVDNLQFDCSQNLKVLAVQRSKVGSQKFTCEAVIAASSDGGSEEGMVARLLVGHITEFESPKTACDQEVCLEAALKHFKSPGWKPRCVGPSMLCFDRFAFTFLVMFVVQLDQKEHA
jgi:hypothetical protein